MLLRISYLFLGMVLSLSLFVFYSGIAIGDNFPAGSCDADLVGYLEGIKSKGIPYEIVPTVFGAAVMTPVETRAYYLASDLETKNTLAEMGFEVRGTCTDVKGNEVSIAVGKVPNE